MCPNRHGLLTEEQIVKLKQTHDTASPALWRANIYLLLKKPMWHHFFVFFSVDHCRVILESLPAEEDSSGSSDYINASYIDVS